MKTKTYIFALFLLAGINVMQAQIRGQVQFNREAIRTNKENGYDKIISNEGFYNETPGSPELPIILKSYLIPVDAENVTVTVQNMSKQKVEGEYTIYPVQPPVFTDGNVNSIFVAPNLRIYESRNPYPGKQAEILSDDNYMGYRIVTVQLYPVEYIPLTKELYLCNFDFTIDYSINVKRNEFNTQTQSLYRYELNKKAVKFRVDNPEAVDNYDTKVQKVVQGKTIVYDFSASSNEKTVLRSESASALNETVPDYIIITCDSLKSAFQPLADWKTKKGIFTVIATTEEINANYSGSDLPEKIRSYLIDTNRKWGSGLYVLLGGNINIIPARFVKSGSLSYPADRYYYTSDKWNNILQSNLFNGPSSLSIINILGRIPVNNTKEVVTYTNKVTGYEKANALGDLNYLRNNLYSDAYLINSGGRLSDFVIDSIKHYTNRYVPSYINNKFICDNAHCEGDINKYSITDYCKNNGCCNGDIELNHENFLSCLNTGANLGIGKFHFIYHMDHGSTVSIGTSSKDKNNDVRREDMDNLLNGPSWQIFMTSCCNSANFQFDCFAKHYLINPNGGGVAYIGNTDVGWSSEYMQLQYLLDALYITTSHPTNLKRYDIGSVFQNIIKKGYSTDWRLHLLGDPEMQVWTNIPQNLTTKITSPAVVTTGQQNVTVSVNGLAADSARICIWKGAEVYETRTVFNGVHSIGVTPETQGTMYVTVTAHNFFPKEDSIIVNQSTNPNLFIQSVHFVDNGSSGSKGNGNGQNDAGETINLQLTLKNNGVNAANNITATLSSTSDSIIAILNNSCNAGSIASNDTAEIQFLYTINKDAPETLSNDTIPVQFKLDLKDASNTTWTKTFNIDVFATDLKQRNKIITNSTGSSFDLQIELQNMGKAPSTVLTGNLSYNNNSIAVSFPVIDYLETQLSNTLHIPLSLASNPNFTLKVDNSYGKEWTYSNFDLAKPGTVDSLQSFAKVKEIDLKWKAPVSGASGYNIYRCNMDTTNGNESGDYIRLNNTPVTYLYYEDADSLKSLTKYYYKVTAVSQSGMESAPVKILAWTSYPTQGRFPIVMDASLTGATMESHFVAEDVNNDGKKEIFTALSDGNTGKVGDIIELDWEGNELFNIDNNVTTYSGFARLNSAIWAGMAIADINQDGINEIISVTRSFYNQPTNNKITCHIAYDNNGDNNPDMLWQVSTPRTFKSGAIIDNLDNSADGSMEIVVVPDGNTDPLYRSPQIYSAQGSLIQELSIPGGISTYAAGAVADLDGDGYKEIIVGYTDGVYVWRHDGSPFGKKNPFFTLPDSSFSSSPVICDINGDGKKEILLSAFSASSPASCKILAIDTDGNMLPGWSTAKTDSNYYTAATNSFSNLLMFRTT